MEFWDFFDFMFEMSKIALLGLFAVVLFGITWDVVRMICEEKVKRKGNNNDG